jgi:hypothetical protein
MPLPNKAIVSHGHTLSLVIEKKRKSRRLMVLEIAKEEAEMLEAKEQDLCFFKRFVFLAFDGWFFYVGVLKFSKSKNCSVPLPENLIIVVFFFFIKFYLTVGFSM